MVNRLMRKSLRSPDARKGFTLLELAIVIVVLGVLAAFGVPRYTRSIERSRASEAFAFLAAVQSAQERYRAVHGEYACSLVDLNIRCNEPRYFVVGSLERSRDDDRPESWRLTLTRSGMPAGYRAYSVVFSDQGYDAERSTIAKLADLNPLGP